MTTNIPTPAEAIEFQAKQNLAQLIDLLDELSTRATNLKRDLTGNPEMVRAEINWLHAHTHGIGARGIDIERLISQAYAYDMAIREVHNVTALAESK